MLLPIENFTNPLVGAREFTLFTESSLMSVLKIVNNKKASAKPVQMASYTGDRLDHILVKNIARISILAGTAFAALMLLAAEKRQQLNLKEISMSVTVSTTIKHQ